MFDVKNVSFLKKNILKYSIDFNLKAKVRMLSPNYFNYLFKMKIKTKYVRSFKV